MEENKDLEQEAKKTTRKTPAKKTADKSSAVKKSTSTTKKTSSTAKKGTGTSTKRTGTKTTTKKETTGGTKKAASSTAKKKTTKTVDEMVEMPQMTTSEMKKIEEEITPIVEEKIEEVVAPIEVEEKVTTEEKEQAEVLEPIEFQEQEEKQEKVEETKKEQPKTIETKTEKPKFETTKKVEKKKEKHTLLKTILVLIIIALVLFLIHFARNYVIMDSLIARRENLKETTNYSYTKKDENTTLEYYNKDNTIIIVRTVDGQKGMIWSNKDTGEVICIDFKNLTATIDNSGIEKSTYGYNPTGISYDWNGNSRIFDSMLWITSDTVNGRSCYKVSVIFGDETAWYDKENGTLLKYSIGDDTIEYTDWKFNQLTDDDMSRPNLMGYDVTGYGTEQKNNENQEENANEQNDKNNNAINEENSLEQDGQTNENTIDTSLSEQNQIDG